MKQGWLTFLTKSFTISAERRLAEKTVERFTPSEKVLVGILVFVFGFSALALAGQVNSAFLKKIPASGGSLSEGIVGFPRFVNPLFAASDADTDLTLLVYSGLMRATPDGTLSPDIAKEVVISEDARVYTFTLREDVTFHDGVPLTANDVAFTIQKAQDPALKSPRRASWDGVGISVIDEHTIQFTLDQPYAPFLENTTLGILPAHIWNEIPIDQLAFNTHNIDAIGSGPYRISDIDRNSSGVPNTFTLRAFGNYALGKPYINTLKLKFYTNETAVVNAYRSGSISGMAGVSPDTLTGLATSNIETVSLPRVFGVFFNQDEAPVFANQEVRRALDAAINKDRVVEEVLSGYGVAIHGPVPPNVLPPSSVTTKKSAADILESAGWELGTDGVWEQDGERLAFTLSTSNTPELKAAAEIVEDEWERFGADVDLQLFEPSILNQNVIRPRQYDSLLFGEVVGRELDLFAFWHSSQRNDPGLNIALYTNITADNLLEDAREITDRDELIAHLEEFQKEVQTDVPTVFLYSPEFIYVIPERIKGVQLGSITIPGERFLNIHKWHIETDHVWTFLTNNNN